MGSAAFLSGLGASGSPVSPVLHELHCFSITHRVVTAENSSCQSPDMQKQHCESISSHENHYYSFSVFILFTRLVPFGTCCIFAVGQRCRLNAEDSWPCFCLVKFSMWHCLQPLWHWGVKVVTFYVKCWIPWAVRASFDAFSFFLQLLMVHLRMCSLSLYLHRASESPGR